MEYLLTPLQTFLVATYENRRIKQSIQMFYYMELFIGRMPNTPYLIPYTFAAGLDGINTFVQILRNKNCMDSYNNFK